LGINLPILLPLPVFYIPHNIDLPYRAILSYLSALTAILFGAWKVSP
jgi:hypothetical protein